MNPGPPCSLAKQMTPQARPRLRSEVARKDFAGTGAWNSGRPNDREWQTMSGILSGSDNPRRYWRNIGPSGVSFNLSCSSGITPEEHEIPVPSRLVNGGDASAAGPGEATGAVDDTLEHHVQVEALVDAQAGLAQPGHPFPQGFDLSQKIVLPVPSPSSSPQWGNGWPVFPSIPPCWIGPGSRADRGDSHHNYMNFTTTGPKHAEFSRPVYTDAIQ